MYIGLQIERGTEIYWRRLNTVGMGQRAFKQDHFAAWDICHLGQFSQATLLLLLWRPPKSLTNWYEEKNKEQVDGSKGRGQRGREGGRVEQKLKGL